MTVLYGIGPETAADYARLGITTLRDLIYVWRGDLSLARALNQGRLELLGETWAVRALPRWLARSKYADVRPARREAGRTRSTTTGASAGSNGSSLRVSESTP